MTTAPENPVHPEDDPVLTAYALGELPAADAAAVALRLQTDPAARDFVASLQDFSGELARQAQQEERNEVDTGLTPAQRRALRQLIAKRAPGRMKFPRLALVCVVAALLLVMFMILMWLAAVRQQRG